MPHIIVEHSNSISKEQALNLGFQVQIEMVKIIEGNFDPDQCKIRSLSFDDFFIGKKSQKDADFIHITIKILKGRSLEVRQKLARQMVIFTENFYKLHINKKLQCDISIDIVEMNSDSYQKVRIN